MVGGIWPEWSRREKLSNFDFVRVNWLGNNFKDDICSIRSACSVKNTGTLSPQWKWVRWSLLALKVTHLRSSCVLVLQSIQLLPLPGWDPIRCVTRSKQISLFFQPFIVLRPPHLVFHQTTIPGRVRFAEDFYFTLGQCSYAFPSFSLCPRLFGDHSKYLWELGLSDMRMKLPNTYKYGPSWTPVTLLCLPSLENNTYCMHLRERQLLPANKVHCPLKSWEETDSVFLLHVIQNHPHSTPSRTSVWLQPYYVPTHERREYVEGRPDISWIYIGWAYQH